MTPREAAKELIRPYVLRGDSIATITRCGQGYRCREYGTHVLGHRIQVYELAGVPCDHWFSLAVLFVECKPQFVQGSLFDEVRA